MAKNKNWSEQEDLILRENYPSGGFHKCMELLPHRPKSGIQWRANSLGIQSNITDSEKLLEKFIKSIKDKGGEPLFDIKEWKYCDNRYLVRCSCGYEWMVRPTALWTRGDWCKGCSGHRKKTTKDYQDLAVKFGGIWLGKEVPKNNKIDTQWQCSQGHKFDNDFNNVQQYNCFCRACKNPYLGQAVTKMYIETLTGFIFQTCRPLFLKQPSGSRLELDGYNKEIKVAFEYNGLEHYKKSGRQSQKAFESLQKRDAWKYKTVKENGIKLLIIDEIKGKFDEEHIKNSIVKFLEQEKIQITIDPKTVSIDLSTLYRQYDLKRVRDACDKLNLTLISNIYVNCETYMIVKCNDCQKERLSNSRNIVHAATRGKTSYCRCATKNGRREKYNVKIAQYGFQIVSDNYQTNHTVLTIKYPDGSLRNLSWMQFYWDHLPRYLKNLAKKSS